jgi:hypothetical protein
MNIPEATAVLRTLATVAGVENPDAITVKLAPSKGAGAYRKGWYRATASGWTSSLGSDGISDTAPSAEAAVDLLLRRAKLLAEYAVEGARKNATRLTLAAQAATTAAANAEADAEMRRLMLASLDAK